MTSPGVPTAASASAHSSSGSGGASSICLNHSKMYQYDASLPNIFGSKVKPGRELLDKIMETYKVGWDMA